MTDTIIDPLLAAYLAPQERFEELRRVWSFRAGASLCDLSYANPYDGPPTAVIDALRAVLDHPRTLDLQYTPYGGATIARRRVAEALTRSHGLDFGWRDVVLTPGAMAALHVVFRALGGPGGTGAEVVVPTPCWLDYPAYCAQLGLGPVLVPSDPSTLRLDLDALDAAITQRTRFVVLTNPGNPSGLVLGDVEVAALARLLTVASDRVGHPVWVVSDESHRGVLMPGTTYRSVAAVYPYTIVVFSFGKHLAIQGQRIGYAAVPARTPGHDALATAFERLCRSMGFATPTALMQRAVPRLLELSPPLDGLATRRDQVVAGLVAAGYDVVPSQATFFLYPRTPGGDDWGFTEAAARQGVLVLPAPVFFDHGRFRIALTGSQAMLERSLEVFSELARA